MKRIMHLGWILLAVLIVMTGCPSNTNLEEIIATDPGSTPTYRREVVSSAEEATEALSDPTVDEVYFSSANAASGLTIPYNASGKTISGSISFAAGRSAGSRVTGVSNPAIRVEASGVTFSDFTVTAGTGFDAIFLVEGAGTVFDNVTITGSDGTPNNQTGIVVEGEGVSISETTISNTPIGIHLKNLESGTVDNVTITGLEDTNNADANTWKEGIFGIKVYNSTGIVLSNIIINNVNAGIHVNSSEVTVSGSIVFNGAWWGGIGVEKSDDNPSLRDGKLTIASGATLRNNSSNNTVKPVIWLEAGEASLEVSSAILQGPYVSTEDGKETQRWYFDSSVTPDTSVCEELDYASFFKNFALVPVISNLPKDGWTMSSNAPYVASIDDVTFTNTQYLYSEVPTLAETPTATGKVDLDVALEQDASNLTQFYVTGISMTFHDAEDDEFFLEGTNAKLPLAGTINVRFSGIYEEKIIVTIIEDNKPSFEYNGVQKPGPNDLSFSGEANIDWFPLSDILSAVLASGDL